MTTESGISNTDNILGDPRKSLMVMVVPIAIGMLVQALNNLVDAIWVSSLGTGALAATGVVFPFFFILVGIGNGLGVGASQAIARRIGTGDRAGASAAAAQVMVIGLIVGVVMTAVFALLAEPIFTVAGAGPYLEETLAYGIPIMLCSPIYMVSFIFSALLRSEGAAKKSMYIQVAGVAAHMVLDPILIFGLDMGITGAAVASALAMVMASLMAVRYYLSGDMYVRFSFRGFRFDRDLDRDILKEVSVVVLSSTLATNSVVEGKGCRVGLICIGGEYNNDVPVEHMARVAGGHDIFGDEEEPLDVEAVRSFLESLRGKVDGLAVSGYMSVRNPTHETRVRTLAREILGVPVVCGHELSTSLGFSERTTTCIMNSRLIPIIDELIRSVEKVLSDLGIRAPLMIFRGNGSIMSCDVARERPVETILSGPAASLMGAKHMTGVGDAVVMDIGGTTTDIGILRGGSPSLEPEGATIGGKKTRVMAAKVVTSGLGGDSRITVDCGRIVLMPQRVVPLCVAAVKWPEIASHVELITRVPTRPSM